jgi:hypothetical protein
MFKTKYHSMECPSAKSGVVAMDSQRHTVGKKHFSG